MSRAVCRACPDYWQSKRRMCRAAGYRVIARLPKTAPRWCPLKRKEKQDAQAD